MDTMGSAAARAVKAAPAAVEAQPIAIGERSCRVTVSCGVAELAPQRRDLQALMAAADAALYEAKRAGRNQVRSS